MIIKSYPSTSQITTVPSLPKATLAAALTLCMSLSAFGHGSLEGSRIIQVRAAGPGGGTPAPWTESYYNWNENSHNFTTYNQPGFSYADYVPDGSIHSAGKNNGVTGHDFAGLNNPGTGWQTTDATAGAELSLKFLATARHEPAFFEVFLTKQGFDTATQSLGWGDLEHLGRWTTAPGPNAVTFGTGSVPWGTSYESYNWDVLIPEDRAGLHTLVVVWQRDDPAGEAFFASKDLDIAAIPEPGTTALTILSGVGLLALVKRRKQRSAE